MHQKSDVFSMQLNLVFSMQLNLQNNNNSLLASSQTNIGDSEVQGLHLKYCSEEVSQNGNTQINTKKTVLE